MWYVILDGQGCIQQHYFESQDVLIEWIETCLRMKRIGENQWARGGKRRVVLAGFKEWSDAYKMAAQITYTSAELKA